MLWFVVRVILEQPSGTPLFSGTIAFADTIFAALAVWGIASFALDSVNS